MRSNHSRILVALVCCVFGTARSWSADEGDYRLTTRGLEVRVSAEGTIAGIRFGSESAERPVAAETMLRGCRLEGAARVSRLPDGGVEFEKQCVAEGGKNRAVLTERFRPGPDSIRWEVEVRGEGKPWSTPIQTVIRWPNAEQSRFWTAWSDPRPQAKDSGSGSIFQNAGWDDPLRSTAWPDRRWTYGNERPEKDSPAISIPIACLLDPAHDVGLSVVLSPEDLYLDSDVKTTSSGRLTWSHHRHRLDRKNVVRFHVDLVAHPADWRGGLAWMSRRYAGYFDPPNPAVQQMAGCGGYADEFDVADVDRLVRMAFRVNWDASFDFPYMAMFIPPVKSDTEEWTDFKKRKTSIAKLRAHARELREHGLFVLNYFNVTEAGNYYVYPPPPRKATKDEDLWKDANDFLYYAVGDAILPGPDGKPIASWEGCVVMDPGEKVYQDFLIEQAQRHLDRVPESFGICIDRMDWIHFYNRQRDDGATWYEGKPARSLVVSWQEIMGRLGPLMHRAGKVVYGNPHYARLDLMKELDGVYDEAGMLGTSLNLCALMAINKPLVEWTWAGDILKTDPDGFFQRHLHLGAYLTAPLPGNDHAIRPAPERDRYYLDYGPLLDAMRGKRWLLLPHVVRVEGDRALANIFETPGGYAVPVTFGKESSAEAVLEGLPTLPGQRGFRAEAIHPGEAQPVAVRPVAEGTRLRINVPLKRGCAMLLLRHTWIEPKAMCFHRDVDVRIGTTIAAGELRYTLDGSEPAADSPVFSAPVKLERTGTVKATVFRDGRQLGATVERRYVKFPPPAPRIAPKSGFFDDAMDVTMESPKSEPGESIHYTLDGSKPTARSPEYAGPVRLDRTAQLRAVRITPGGTSFEAVARFMRRGPKPPRPDVSLTDLTPEKATTGWGERPLVNRSIGNNPLTLGGTVYERGIGTSANSELRYAARPEYTRFVAAIGVDDAMRAYTEGTVVFEVWIDDARVLGTPVMRPGDYTHVDVAIPAGSKHVRLLALSTGDGINCDHANWAEAGFVVRPAASSEK